MNYQPGQVDLKSLSLFNHKGQEISIIASTVELNIYNDINVAGTSVELVFVDGIGLVNAFPIVGDELLVVSFKTPDMEDHKFEKIDYKPTIYMNLLVYLILILNQSLLLIPNLLPIKHLKRTL